MKSCATDGFVVLGLDEAGYGVLRPAVLSLDKGRSSDTREALEALAAQCPDYAALGQYVLSGLLAKNDDERAIAAYRAQQDADGLAGRFSECRRFFHLSDGAVLDEAPGVRVVAEGEQGSRFFGSYASVWKLGGGSRLYELEPRASGLVVEGLFKKYLGDEESVVVEVECEGGRERVRFNSGLVILGSTSEAVRVRVAERFVPFRLVAHRDEFRLYVDGLSALHAGGERLGAVRRVRLGLRSGLDGIDTNLFVSSLRLCWGARPRVSLEDLAPFPGFEAHLNNLAVAWFQLGKPPRALALLATALETEPRPEILANFVTLVDRMAEDLDLEDRVVRRGLAVVALKQGEEAAARLRTLVQQRRRAVAISCREVSVYFAKAPHRVNRPGEIARRLMDPRGYFERNYWWPVRDVSFEVRYGEVVAIVGNNGAGKSTLLRAVAGILDHRGTVVVNGNTRLLVMGLGVQEELSGRDNILLGCLYLGLRRRAILARMDSILDFAGLVEFADVPYKYYSDGMKARLLFSIATSVEPDILLLDELLGAGDVTFRAKAMERMNRLLEHSKAMVVVTHNLTFVREKARRALYMDKGRVVYYGDPNQAVDLYLSRGHREVPGPADPYLMEEV